MSSDARRAASAIVEISQLMPATETARIMLPLAATRERTADVASISAGPGDCDKFLETLWRHPHGHARQASGPSA